MNGSLLRRLSGELAALEREAALAASGFLSSVMMGKKRGGGAEDKDALQRPAHSTTGAIEQFYVGRFVGCRLVSGLLDDRSRVCWNATGHVLESFELSKDRIGLEKGYKCRRGQAAPDRLRSRGARGRLRRARGPASKVPLVFESG